MDSPVKALLPFSYDHALTLVLSNVWTCLAVLSAAGAVRFLFTTNKSSTSPSLAADSHQKPDPVHSCCQDLTEPVAETTASVPATDCTEGIITRGKFVEYYYEESEDRENIICDEEAAECDGEWDFRGREIRMGWYRYQDLTVFNGNVVRLWDDRLIT